MDKTGLIGLINQTINTPGCLTCVSRPRRFGKSFAAQMLCAYYDKTCDSAGLFDDLAIAGDGKYRDYLNRYDEEESPLYYNDEQALRSVIKRAYSREAPAGKRKHQCRIEKYEG